MGCLVTGCKVGPDYVPPDQPIPDEYAWADPQQEAPPAEPETWWHRFDDPTLDTLIAKATFDNFDLRIAAERIDEYRAIYGIAASELYPDIGAIASYSRERTPGTDFTVSGFTLGGSPYNSYTVGLDASWEIDLFGRIARSIEAAQGDLQAVVEDWRYAMVSIRAEVATSYIAMRTLQARLAVVESNVASQRRFVELLELQLAAGTTTEAQVAQARAQLAQDEALIPEYASALTEQLTSLAILLGTTPGVLADSLPSGGGIPVPPGDVAVGIPADLIRRRPDIRAAERTLAAATARVGQATADLYPKLSLSGQFGFGASSFHDLFQWSSRAYAAGPAFTWDIFNGDRLKSVVKEQESVTRQALLSYEQTVIQAIGEVEGSLLGFVLAIRQRDDLRTAARAAEQSYQLTLDQYEHGVTDFLNVITAQQTMLSAQDALAQARGLAAESLVAVYRSIGGGWTPDVLPDLASDSKESPS
ncbi:MAG: efflux transporter outer membrane subunit [Phycisphaerales bacterium]|jgi:NodT family efflux transporter outer membrane factor (OMF) lipoprotein|nr:efflux transporter outer membrane subunit [Phycisphaerales bacterium]